MEALWSKSRSIPRPNRSPSTILTIDRALEWRRHWRNFHAPSVLDPLPIPSVADGSALPPLLPGSGLFRRARWNYVRKAFFSPVYLPPPSPSALYTRLSQPTSHFPLFILFVEPSYQRRLRRTTLRSFPLTLYKTRLKLVTRNSLAIFFAIYRAMV